MKKVLCTRYEVPEDDHYPFPPPEQYQPPTDPKKIRQCIRRYERDLEREREEYGHYGDGAGKRFLLGPFYMLMGDLDGALKSFEWFESEFDDNNGDAPHLLCWALALYRAGREDEAQRKLMMAMRANLYVIPSLLCVRIEPHDMWHSSNCAAPSYVNWIPDEYYALWSEEERAWARTLWNSIEFEATRKRHIESSRKPTPPPSNDEWGRTRPRPDVMAPRKRRMSAMRRQVLAYEMHESGLSQASIGKELGISSKSVGQVLKRHEEYLATLQGDNPLMRTLAEMGVKAGRIKVFLKNSRAEHDMDAQRIADMGPVRMAAYKNMGYKSICTLAIALEKLGCIKNVKDWMGRFWGKKACYVRENEKASTPQSSVRSSVSSSTA